MKLYVTTTSPYARMARIVLHEQSLADRVTVIEATTRVPESPYYAVNPSGRVPYLVREGAAPLEDSALICRYLDGLRAAPVFSEAPPEDPWEGPRLEALARSWLDGLAVWARELRRPPGEQSPGIIDHEAARARRFAEHWNREIESPWMQGLWNYAQLALIVTLELDRRIPEFSWREKHPALCAWAERVGARASVIATR